MQQAFLFVGSVARRARGKGGREAKATPKSDCKLQVTRPVVGRAEELFERIKQRGAAQVHDMISAQVVEELFLDYKL